MLVSLSFGVLPSTIFLFGYDMVRPIASNVADPSLVTVLIDLIAEQHADIVLLQIMWRHCWQNFQKMTTLEATLQQRIALAMFFVALKYVLQHRTGSKNRLNI